MDKIEQKKPDQAAPVVSPLATEKTYGERVFTRIFDNFLNYWTNLLSSAGFSQWAEHGTNRVKIPGVDAALPSAREYQQDLARTIRTSKYDPGMQGLPGPLKVGPFKGFKNKIAELVADGTMTKREGEFAVFDRSMARARSLTLLIPGFAVMIPSVWLGAKIKPWFVEKLNAWHYGKDSLEDPTLQARHQAIAAEVKPTLLGTFIARLGTMAAVQIAAQSIGSRNNFVNELGKDNKILKTFAIDPVTEHAGESMGSAMPRGLRNSYNAFAAKHGLDWSNHQIGAVMKSFATSRGINAKEVNPELLANATAELIQLRRAVPLVHSAGKSQLRAALNQREEGTKDILQRLLTAHLPESSNPINLTDPIHLSGELHKRTVGKYTNATQDLGRFIAADTFYTLISAGTIRPFLKLLKYVPFMSYKSKNAPETPTIDGEPLKVPSHPMATASADTSPEKMTADAIAKAKESSKAAAKPEPKPSISTITNEGTLNERLMEAAV